MVTNSQPDEELRSIEEITRRVDAALVQAGSSITGDEIYREQLHAQIKSVVTATLSHLRNPMPVARSIPRHNAPLDLGGVRAAQDIHPSESLFAAEILFEVALDVIVDTSPAAAPRRVFDVACALNSEISSVIAQSSVSYVDVLLTRLAAVQREERLAIARELHDRVANDLAAARMQLELRSALSDTGGETAVAVQSDAEILLRRAQTDVQSLAMQLREVVGEKTVARAIEEFLGHADIDHRATLTKVGTEPPLSSHVREETFLIIREAVRNALAHAAPSNVHIRVATSDGVMAATIHDDGSGFDLAASRPGAMGLVGMRERAELIGATLEIDSIPSAGTTITLQVPYYA